MNKELFKGGGLNFHTVFLFTIPLVIGIKKKFYDISRGCMLIIITGLAYHYTYIKPFEILNKIMVSICGTYYLILGYTYTYYYLGSIICILTSIIIYKALSYSKYGIVLHSLMHSICSVGISFLVLGCSSVDQCQSLKNITFY